MGWVSILDPAAVAAFLDVPAEWRFIGYFCLGYPAGRRYVPELERSGWERRALPSSVIIHSQPHSQVIACAARLGLLCQNRAIGGTGLAPLRLTPSGCFGLAHPAVRRTAAKAGKTGSRQRPRRRRARRERC